MNKMLISVTVCLAIFCIVFVVFRPINSKLVLHSDNGVTKEIGTKYRATIQTQPVSPAINQEFRLSFHVTSPTGDIVRDEPFELYISCKERDGFGPYVDKDVLDEYLQTNDKGDASTNVKFIKCEYPYFQVQLSHSDGGIADFVFAYGTK